ncbi:MAG: selenide, water dikinase SelD [Terracidiphilus sp.]
MDHPQPIRLTQQVKAGGCASKLPAGSLRRVLAALPAQSDPNLLVGFETSDDAGIFRIGPSQALVQTIDFFTPLVDDPFTFGQIAAANALSDVYAMGGRPLTALAVVCFPQEADLGVLEQIMRGGLAKMAEAKCTVAGGHSVRDAEMKFGYAVTGLIDPARVYTNSGAIPGDSLILTKPIGTGVITTALKQGKAETAWVDRATHSMTTLNSTAASLATACAGVHSITDITGFGLMGHGREMALGSGVTLEIETARVPLIEGALAAVRAGAIPGGLLSNREFAECLVEDSPESQIPDDLRALLYDPQTSGGLLISVAFEDAQKLLASLLDAGLPAAIIGRVSSPFSAGAGGPAIVLR